jgi:hypothetical protein
LQKSWHMATGWPHPLPSPGSIQISRTPQPTHPSSTYSRCKQPTLSALGRMNLGMAPAGPGNRVVLAGKLTFQMSRTCCGREGMSPTWACPINSSPLEGHSQRVARAVALYQGLSTKITFLTVYFADHNPTWSLNKFFVPFLINWYLDLQTWSDSGSTFLSTF